MDFVTLGFRSNQLRSEYALLVKKRTTFLVTRVSRKPERAKEGRGPTVTYLSTEAKGGAPGARDRL